MDVLRHSRYTSLAFQEDVFNTTGANNTADGLQALFNNTVGNYNTASGVNALFSNVGDSASDGWYNTAIGYQALYNNNDTSGLGLNARYNTAVGAGALFNNTTAEYNTAVGASALFHNTWAQNWAHLFGVNPSVQNCRRWGSEVDPVKSRHGSPENKRNNPNENVRLSNVRWPAFRFELALAQGGLFRSPPWRLTTSVPLTVT